MKGDFSEGQVAFDAFKSAMQTILAVPHERVAEAVKQHKRDAAKNPNRRGPKAKPKSAA